MLSKKDIIELLMEFSDEKELYFDNDGENFDSLAPVTFSYDRILCASEHLYLNQLPEKTQSPQQPIKSKTHQEIFDMAVIHTNQVKEAAKTLRKTLNNGAVAGHQSGYYKGYKDAMEEYRTCPSE